MWLLFMPPFEFTDVTVFGATFSNGYIWLFAMLTLFYIGSTVKDLPFSAWGAELSNEYHERTLIMSWKEGLGVFGSLVSSFIPLFILFFGQVKPTDAVYWLVLVMCISMPIVNLNCLIVVPEWRVVEQPRRIGVFEGLKIVVKNKPYMILVIVFALGAIGSAMTNSLSLFFVKHVMQVGEIYGAYLAPYFVCQIAAIPLWFKLSRRIGKHKTIMWAIGWYSLWSSFIPLVMIAPTDWFSLFELQKYNRFPVRRIPGHRPDLLDGSRKRQAPHLPGGHVPQGLRDRGALRHTVRNVRGRGGRRHRRDRPTPVPGPTWRSGPW